MRYLSRRPVITLFLIALTGGQALAFEPLSSEELASHCTLYRDDPEGKDGISSVRFYQGFIDGAVATDERVAINVAAEYDKEENFIQRAMRTRPGSRMDQFGSSYDAGFCLGAPVPLAEVVGRVVDDLGDGLPPVNSHLSVVA